MKAGLACSTFRSEGRRFADSRRCLVPASALFEFTGKKYPKAKHRFALKGSPITAIAGLWREGQGNHPPSFTMLATKPGPDVAPYHDRQVVVLRPQDWASWIHLTKPETEVLQTLAKGSAQGRNGAQGKRLSSGWRAVEILARGARRLSLRHVDGCIPSDLGVGSTPKIEEELRLLYVAMTRAKDQLHLMVPQCFFTHWQRSLRHRHVYAQRRRFIPNGITKHFQTGPPARNLAALLRVRLASPST